MGFLESFAEKEREIKSKEYIKQIQEEYAEELAMEMELEKHFDEKQLEKESLHDAHAYFEKQGKRREQ